MIVGESIMNEKDNALDAESAFCVNGCVFRLRDDFGLSERARG